MSAPASLRLDPIDGNTRRRRFSYEQARDLRRKGWTISKLARKMGVAESTLGNAIKGVKRGPVCSVKNCHNAPHTGGICHKHYRRKLRHGSTDTVKKRGRVPKIDAGVASELRARGWQVKAIAALYGVSASAVSQMLKSHAARVSA